MKGATQRSVPGGARRIAVAGEARAADALIERLEDMISEGALADGARLPPERDLMQQFSVSRTVVREAIAALSARGLLEMRPRFRPVVRKPGYDTALGALGGIVHHLLREPGGVRNLYDTRILIEAALARHAALHARRDDIRALRDALADNRAAVEDAERFYATDAAFHGVLYRIPKNPIYPALHEAYVAWLWPHWQEMTRSVEINRANLAAHEAIVSAIVERDPEAAEQSLQRHLEAAWEYVRGILGGLQR